MSSSDVLEFILHYQKSIEKHSEDRERVSINNQQSAYERPSKNSARRQKRIYDNCEWHV